MTWRNETTHCLYDHVSSNITLIYLQKTTLFITRKTQYL
uniref:Uncharacterized protein n=1 Tax=Lepeophtheirus salmonis TaxID=72036 RepID=A0A0K2T7Y7_LEPSM